MNKKSSIFLFLIGSLFAQLTLAHDDLIYRTSGQWFVDYGNQGIISESGTTEGADHVFWGDYNGDGLMDICYVRTGQELIQWEWRLNDGEGGWTTLPAITFGVSQADKVIIGDFNGDGMSDIAVLRNSSSTIFASWYIDFAPCDGNYDARGNFGLNGDIPLSGDFNADGVDDMCIYRPSDGTWYVALSDITGYPDFNSPLAINGVQFGEATDIPVTGDFNGDGYTDIALFKKDQKKTVVNLYNRDKPRFEHYADRNGKGTIDMEISCPVSDNILSVYCVDKDNSRPKQLPLATENEYGTTVNLRHGWTCIFDNSLDVDKWTQAWQAAGINTLEYHPWMRAHEEIAPVGETWNTYVGDDRLWTSKEMMKKKIEKFRSIGGRSICYTGIYAATPAFANNYPNWAMRSITNGDFITYGNSYLYLMGTNEQINYPYEVNGITFKNFNDYFVHQAEMAQNEYNWDGWRWDWYGLPERYACGGLTGEGNFSYEMSVLVERLKLAVKNIRQDCTTTALQLPTAGGDIPNQLTATVVDHQFMELWPYGTGERYQDLYNDMYRAKSKYPDKPVFANFYPPAEMNLTTSWPLINIDYQFATSISAGGYPAATLVDGVAGFTDPVPFHAVNYPDEILERIADWNDFLKAYGPYFYYSNPAYLITDYTEANLIVNNTDNGLFAKLKKRRDKRTHQVDALVLNVINYGNSTELKWTERNTAPSGKNISVEFDLPAGFEPKDVYAVNLDGRNKLNYTTSNGKLQMSYSGLNLFVSLVVTSANSPLLPDEPVENTVEFPDLKFEYDAEGKTIRPSGVTRIDVMEDQAPLEIGNRFGDNIATWEFIEDAYSGEKAVRVTPGMLTIPSTSDGAVRVPINEFKNFSVAIRANDTKASWIGFRLIKPSESPVWETRDLFYRIGFNQPNLGYITIYPLKPQSGVWKEYARNIQEDAKSLLGEEWGNAIVTAVHYGPVDEGTADYDRLMFTTDGYSGIESLKKKEDEITVYPNPVKGDKLTVLLSDGAIESNYQIQLSDLLGRVLISSDMASRSGKLECSLPGIGAGYYLLQITNKDTGYIYSAMKIKYE